VGTCRRQQPKQQRKAKRGSSSILPSDTPDEVDSTSKSVLSTVTSVETRLTAVEKTNAEFCERIDKLEASNIAFKLQSEETGATLQVLIQAVLGDQVAVNKIRNRVLLDMGRNKLATICGHKNWEDWNASFNTRDEMFNSASTRLNNAAAVNDLPHQWTVLGNRPTALRMLLLPSPVLSCGDGVAHASAQKLIEESVLALMVEQERDDMISICEAVYGTKLVH